MFFRHRSFHIEQQHCEQRTVHNFSIDIPNLLNYLILTRNTLPLSSFLPLFIYLSISHSSLFYPLSSLSLYLLVLSSLPSFSLSFSVVHSSSLPLYLPLLLSFFLIAVFLCKLARSLFHHPSFLPLP